MGCIPPSHTQPYEQHSQLLTPHTQPYEQHGQLPALYTHECDEPAKKKKNWQKKKEKKKLSAKVSGVMVWRGRRGTTPLTCTWQQEPERMGHVRVVVMRKGHTSQRQALHLRTCFCGRAMARLDACTSWGPGCARNTSGMIGTSCVAVSRLRSR